MDKFLNDITDVLKKAFAQDWVILATALGCIITVFASALLIATFSGDFARCFNACRLITNGKVEQGLKKMKRQVPEFNPKLEYAPPAAAFDFDKLVSHPYSYSAVKRSAGVILGAAVFFAALAVGLCILTEADGGFIALCVITSVILGGVLFFACLLVSAAHLKKAGAAFNKMVAAIKGMTVTAATQWDLMTEEPEVSASINELHIGVKRFAAEGGDYSILQEFYQRLKEERENPANSDEANARKLSETADILELLLDAAE